MTDPIRAQPRHRRRLSVSLGERLPAFTADVSPGGFSGEMAGVFMPGSTVHGSILMGRTRYSFEGEVRWAHPGNPSLSLRSRFGVRFTRIPQALRDVLEKPAPKLKLRVRK